jgi:hypothetical protein
MIKNILLALILVFAFYSCDKSEKKDTLNKLIEESLSSNKNVEKVFLNLKFGISKIQFQNEMNYPEAEPSRYQAEKTYF